MPKTAQIRAAIYDLDGVLLDTEPLYTRVTQEIVAEYGKVFDWSVKRHMIGRPSLEAAGYLVDALSLPMSPADYLDRRRDRLAELFRDTPAVEGARDFTARLAARGLGQAIATSSELELYDIKAAGHKDWFEVFGAVVTGDHSEVARGKPAPDIFLVAARELGADPGHCVVFEDSPAGVEAARAAGMRVVALPDPAMPRAPYATADLVVDGFGDIELERLGL